MDPHTRKRTEVEHSHALVMDTAHVLQKSELPVDVQTEIPESGPRLSSERPCKYLHAAPHAEIRVQPFAATGRGLSQTGANSVSGRRWSAAV